MVTDAVSASTTPMVVELITRLLSRRTQPGQGHVILSEVGLEEWMRRELRYSLGQGLGEPSIRALRNLLVHGVVTTNYDQLIELILAEQGRGHRAAVDQPLRDRLRATLAEVSEQEATDVWLEVAVTVVDSFVQRLLADVPALGKLEPDEAERLGHDAAGDVIGSARWSQVVGDRIDTSTATQLLGVSRQALFKRQGAGSLLGLPGTTTTWYPTWQFDFDAGAIRSEVREIIGAFRDRLDDVDPLLIASWARTPQDEDLDGLTPEQWIRDGHDPERLRVAAERAASRLAR